MWRLWFALRASACKAPTFYSRLKAVCLFTRFADHFYVRNRHVTMLSIALLHATVLRSFFRVFLHVVHLRIRDDSGRSHRMTHMLGKSHSSAPHFPCASVVPRKEELFRAITFCKAPGNIPHVCLFLRKTKCTTRKNHTQKQLVFHILLSG